jgi:hypothetical protein
VIGGRSMRLLVGTVLFLVGEKPRWTCDRWLICFGRCQCFSPVIGG